MASFSVVSNYCEDKEIKKNDIDRWRIEWDGKGEMKEDRRELRLTKRYKKMT